MSQVKILINNVMKIFFYIRISPKLVTGTIFLYYHPIRDLKKYLRIINILIFNVQIKLKQNCM